MPQTYFDDYESSRMGRGNPYRCCSECRRSAPSINGRLEGHAENCSYRLKKEAEREELGFGFVPDTAV